jgi:hypothetical protein
MKRYIHLFSVTALALAITFTSCKKQSKDSTDISTEVTTHSDDQNTVSADMDAVTNDINVAVEGSTTFTGREMTPQTPPTSPMCNANVTFDTLNNQRKITITYTGADCLNGHSRTGVVTLSMPIGAHWKNAGTTLTVTYQNLKITRLSDNKSITINGTHTIVNVSGGLLINLPTLQSITHTINSSSMTITFDDGTQRSWQVARKRVYTFVNNELIITISGNHTEGTNTQIAEWGTNRFGHAFTTSITQPLVIRSGCNFRLTAGQITHQGFATITGTFGLDLNGNPTTCPTGFFYVKITWTGPGGVVRTAILPY